MDIRNQIVERKIVITIKDYTNLPFDNIDLEAIAEDFEDVLRRNYDVVIDLIEIENNKLVPRRRKERLDQRIARR